MDAQLAAQGNKEVGSSAPGYMNMNDSGFAQ